MIIGLLRTALIVGLPILTVAFILVYKLGFKNGYIKGIKK